jgi:hypothetical protein
VIGVIDIVGLYILFNGKRLVNVLGDIDIKIMSIGLGWAFAELLTGNFINIILQGWANEMKSEYLFNALSANLDLLEILSVATFAYILTKKEENGAGKKFIIFILVLARYLLPTGLRFVKENQVLGPNKEVIGGCYDCLLLGVKATFSIVFYLAAKSFK